MTWSLGLSHLDPIYSLHLSSNSRKTFRLECLIFDFLSFEGDSWIREGKWNVFKALK